MNDIEKKILADYLADLCEGGSLRLVKPTEPILYRPAIAVTDVAAEVLPWETFIKDFLAPRGGAAVAAPQVGIPFAFFVSRIRGLPLAINPKVTSRSGARVSKQELSLTWPGRYTYMARHEECTGEFLGRDGKPYNIRLRGFDARIFQNMCESLAGMQLFSS